MKIIFKIFLIVITFPFSASLAQPRVKTDSLKNHALRIANLYVDPRGRIKGNYLIDESGVSIFATPQDKQNNKPEVKIYWDEVASFNQLLKNLSNEEILHLYKNKKTSHLNDSLNNYFVPDLKFKDGIMLAAEPLKGLKIALDPGHVSGNIETAVLELKYLKLKKDSLAGITSAIELIEGNLTLATAIFLRKMLEDAGAEVMLTRDKPNTSSYGVTFDNWLTNATKQTFETAHKNGEISNEEKNRFIKFRSPKDIFQNYFRFADLYERARLVNMYKPDLTVIIHYNVDEKNKPWTSPTSKNFSMVFVPGDVKPGFLRRIENRLGLLRMLISNDLEESIALGNSIVQNFESTLNIPTALPHQASYLKDDCIPTFHKGVYVRNLALTRLIRGPVAYGESLYQDNINECLLLNQLTLEVGGVKTSERVKQVAQSYYQGILNYVLKQKKI